MINIEISEEMIQRLIAGALQARDFSYAPYSHFSVGAALLAIDGTIYQGSNVENASYSVTNCAERSALFAAVSAGKREFIALAVAGGAVMQVDSLPLCTPCGVCRQALFEFANEEFPIYLVQAKEQYQKSTLQELLPKAFGPKQIEI